MVEVCWPAPRGGVSSSEKNQQRETYLFLHLVLLALIIVYACCGSDAFWIGRASLLKVVLWTFLTNHLKSGRTTR